MTSVLMIFEITRDYAVIVPLMISNLVSFFISSKLQPKAIYDELAYQDGIHLPRAESRQQEMQRQVQHAMRQATGGFQVEVGRAQGRTPITATTRNPSFASKKKPIQH